MGARMREARAFSELEDAVDDLLHGLRLDALAAVRAVGHADAREEQAQVVGDLGDGADGRARALGERALLDGDRRREPSMLIDVGLGELLEELPRVGRQRLDVAALPLGVDGVERERRLARAARPGDDDQAIAGELAADVSKVVLARAANDQAIHRSS